MSMEPSRLHGNYAKMDRKKEILSAYINNTVTMSDHKDGETPIVPEENVIYAKKFVEINQK